MLPLLLALLASPQDATTAAHQWGQWRGPLATGVAPHADPPVTWSEEQNVRWKVALPGRGHSSPVVWDDLVLVTAAIPVGEPLEPRPSKMEGAHDNTPVTSRQRYVVRAHDRQTGALVWETTVHEAIPHDTAHVSGGYASASPITDGEHVFAFFGSEGLYALDLEGQLLRGLDLGEMQVKHSHGEGAGPALHGDTLVLVWDHEGDSLLVALDKRSFDIHWRIPRDEPTSWATPIVVPVGDHTQVVVAGTNRLRGYDLEDGRVVWECGGLSHNVVASPVHSRGVVVATSSYEKQAMLAVRLEGAFGDLTSGEDEHLLWLRRRRTPYVPSPLLYQDVLYNLVHYQPMLCRTDLETGNEGIGTLRLSTLGLSTLGLASPDLSSPRLGSSGRGTLGSLYASPVAAAGRVYLTDMDGATLVLEHTTIDKAPRALALNQLDDRFSASAAVAGRELFLRGDRYLYCLAED